MTAESGRTAAVTGASRGIGRATAIALAKQGFTVFALARSEKELERLVYEGRILPVVMDVADDASRRRACEIIMANTSGYGLDVVVNCAGYGLLGPMEEIDPEELRRQLEVNVVGAHAFTRPFLAGMRERRRGWLVNVSSAAGRTSTPFMGAYSASKYALEGMSDALRLELAPFGVHVILIEPGPIRTRFGEDAVRVIRPDSPYARFERRWQATRGASNLLERGPDAVARVIVRSIRAERPRARYRITVSARLGEVGRRLAPDRLLDRFFRRAMGD